MTLSQRDRDRETIQQWSWGSQIHRDHRRRSYREHVLYPAQHRTAPQSTAPPSNRTEPNRTFPALPYCTQPYPTVPNHTLLYSTMPYCTQPYPTVLNYTLLYPTIPYCTQPYPPVPKTKATVGRSPLESCLVVDRGHSREGFPCSFAVLRFVRQKIRDMNPQWNRTLRCAKNIARTILSVR